MPHVTTIYTDCHQYGTTLQPKPRNVQVTHSSPLAWSKYCNSLLHNIPLSQTARLQRVQNNAARLITRTSTHIHVTPVLKELHWLPVKSRIAFKMLVMTFKCMNGFAPSYLVELVLLRTRDGRLRQNYAPTLHQGTTKKCIGDSAFGATAPRLWNNLPVNIRASGSLRASFY